MSLKPHVFMTTKHPGDAFDYLAANAQAVGSGSNDPISASALMDGLVDKDAVVSVIPDILDASVFAKLPRLKVVANVAVGFDNIKIPDATAAGILVLNTPGVLDNTTADMAFALMLAAARRIVEADKYVRAGSWKTWTFDLLLGTDLGGKTLGIVGLGRIGQAMAKRARAFDMQVVYSGRKPVDAAIEAAYDARFVSMEELLKTSDFVSLHCPLTEATRHLISTRELAMMKNSAILVNTARGAVVDEAALIIALKTRQIRAAGLDVFEHEPTQTSELLQLSNTVLAPHIGSASVETRSAMARLAVHGLLSAFSGSLPDNAVNPEVWPKFLERIAAEVCCS